MLRLISLFWVLLLSLCVMAETPNLTLAKRYQKGIAVSEYFVSEKLDGVRGYWDGQRLLTRNGNVIHAPPSFTENWPSNPMDGELWIARGRYDEVSGIVRRKVPEAENWQSIRFMVFDLHPNSDSPDLAFHFRLGILRTIILQANNDNLELVPQFSLRDEDELLEYLSRVVDSGAEGLILHRKMAHYRGGRSDDILKLKPFWDAEAEVIGYKRGKGKYSGLMGSLKVRGLSEMVSQGKVFYIGTGFSDFQRQSPPAIGAVVTYRFNGYTQNGLPRFASFLRVR